MHPFTLLILILTCALSSLHWLLFHAVEVLRQEDLNSHEMKEGVHRHPEGGGQEIHWLLHSLTATNQVGLINQAHIQLNGNGGWDSR